MASSTVYYAVYATNKVITGISKAALFLECSNLLNRFLSFPDEAVQYISLIYQVK